MLTFAPCMQVIRNKVYSLRILPLRFRIRESRSLSDSFFFIMS